MSCCRITMQNVNIVLNHNGSHHIIFLSRRIKSYWLLQNLFRCIALLLDMDIRVAFISVGWLHNDKDLSSWPWTCNEFENDAMLVSFKRALVNLQTSLLTSQL